MGGRLASSRGAFPRAWASLEQSTSTLPWGRGGEARGHVAGGGKRGFRGSNLARGEDGGSRPGVEAEAGSGAGPRPTTPWARSLVSGMDLLRNPMYNKGMAFTEEERDRFHLRGLLPPAHFSQARQVERVIINLRACSSPLEKYVMLMELQERNENLFYAVLSAHIEELMPIIYSPTVGQACREFGFIYRRPRGLFLTINDLGKVHETLKNWPEKGVKAVVATDGENIPGLGDMGVNGMGMPVGKCSLYTACGGIPPRACLPIMIDVGTENEHLLSDPFYIGLRHRRVRGERYDELIEEFVIACKKRFGDSVLIQFDNFRPDNSQRILNRYRGEACIFFDAVSATGSVVLAGLMASLHLTGKGSLLDHTYLLYADGDKGVAIAEALVTAMCKLIPGLALEKARKKVWILDRHQGLVTQAIQDDVGSRRMLYAHDVAQVLGAGAGTAPLGRMTVAEAVALINPSVLIGTSGNPGSFDEAACKAMARTNERPVIMPLSTPISRTECTAEEAYRYTEGRAILATGPKYQSVELSRGEYAFPAQCNNAYIFPGLALGVIASGATRVREEMFIAAARALAQQTTKGEQAGGLLFPRMARIRETSAHVAWAVAQTAYDLNLAARLPKPAMLNEHCREIMYTPEYRPFI